MVLDYLGRDHKASSSRPFGAVARRITKYLENPAGSSTVSRTGKRWRTPLCSVPMLLAQLFREHLKIEEVGVHRAVAS